MAFGVLDKPLEKMNPKIVFRKEKGLRALFSMLYVGCICISLVSAVLISPSFVVTDVKWRYSFSHVVVGHFAVKSVYCAVLLR